MDSINTQFSISERFSSINAWHKTRFHARYLQRGQDVSQIERSQSHGSSMLSGDIGKEPVLGRHENVHRTLWRIRLETSACICSWMSGVMSVISMYRVI